MITKQLSTYQRFLLEHKSLKHKTLQHKAHSSYESQPTTDTIYGSLRFVAAWYAVVFIVRGFHNWLAYHYPLCTI